MNRLKSLFLLLTCLLSVSYSFCQNATIRGKVNDNSFQKVALQTAYGNQLQTLQTADIDAQGNFTITTKVQEHDIYRLFFGEKEVCLITLAPNDKIDITFDGQNVQQIKSVTGSKSISFIKEVSDLLAEKNEVMESINKSLQSDQNQLFFNNFAQEFSRFHQTNGMVGNNVLKVYDLTDSLIAITTRSSKQGKVDKKLIDKYLAKSVEQLKALDNAFLPFENYQNNVKNHYNFDQNRDKKQEDFYKNVDKYLETINALYGQFSATFSPFIAENRQFLAIYDSLSQNGLLEKSKNKATFGNEMVVFVEKNRFITQNRNDMVSSMELAKLLAKELTTTAQQEVSGIVQQYQLRYNAEEKRINDQLVQILRQNQQDIAILMFIENLLPKDQNPVFYGEIMRSLNENYPKNPLVQQYYTKWKAETGPLAIGAVAPDLEYANPDGKMMKLSDLRGKVVLIDFWASWCRPCRNENPHVVKMYHKYHDKGFDVYSVSLDRDKNSWVKAIESDKLVWENHVSDLKYWSSDGAKKYQVSSIPSTFLLDREGRIIGKNLRGDALTQKLKEIFGE